MLPDLFITRETKMQGLGSGRKLEQSKDQSPALAALRNSTTLPSRALGGLHKPLPATLQSCCTRKPKKDPRANIKLGEQGIFRFSILTEFRDPSVLPRSQVICLRLIPLSGGSAHLQAQLIAQLQHNHGSRSNVEQNKVLQVPRRTEPALCPPGHAALLPPVQIPPQLGRSAMQTANKKQPFPQRHRGTSYTCLLCRSCPSPPGICWTP